VANKEWLITKVAITSLALVSLISICIGGANVLFEVKRGVVRVERDIVTHKVAEDKQWEKVWMDVDTNTDDIHAIEVNDSKQQAQYDSLKADLAEIKMILKGFEVK
jgi:hypothetical protein